MFGYIGLIFAMIYIIPQIIKIYKNKKGEDISSTIFVLHNFAYIFFLVYIIRYNPDNKDSNLENLKIKIDEYLEEEENVDNSDLDFGDFGLITEYLYYN